MVELLLSRVVSVLVGKSRKNSVGHNIPFPIVSSQLSMLSLRKNECRHLPHGPKIFAINGVFSLCLYILIKIWQRLGWSEMYGREQKSSSVIGI